MMTKVQSWGNSQGLRLSKQVLEEARIAVGDQVHLSVCDGVIHIAPAKRIRGACDLRSLVAKIPCDDKPEKIEWVKPTGKEAW